MITQADAWDSLTRTLDCPRSPARWNGAASELVRSHDM
jgi:hypothetical protein